MMQRILAPFFTATLLACSAASPDADTAVADNDLTSGALLGNGIIGGVSPDGTRVLVYGDATAVDEVTLVDIKTGNKLMKRVGEYQLHRVERANVFENESLPAEHGFFLHATSTVGGAEVSDVAWYRWDGTLVSEVQIPSPWVRIGVAAGGTRANVGSLDGVTSYRLTASAPPLLLEGKDKSSFLKPDGSGTFAPTGTTLVETTFGASGLLADEATRTMTLDRPASGFNLISTTEFRKGFVPTVGDKLLFRTELPTAHRYGLFAVDAKSGKTVFASTKNLHIRSMGIVDEKLYFADEVVAFPPTNALKRWDPTTGTVETLATEDGGKLEFVGASADGSYVIFAGGGYESEGAFILAVPRDVTQPVARLKSTLGGGVTSKCDYGFGKLACKTKGAASAVVEVLDLASNTTETIVLPTPNDYSGATGSSSLGASTEIAFASANRFVVMNAGELYVVTGKTVTRVDDVIVPKGSELRGWQATPSGILYGEGLPKVTLQQYRTVTRFASF